MTPKKLRELGDSLFGKVGSLRSLQQEIAEQFYPERADFTVQRHLGTDFASNLTTSYPLLCRRDLGDQIGVMLRPTQKAWFHMVPRDLRITRDQEASRWLEWAESVQRRAMYDRDSLFTRATKEADHDFAAFGNTVISVELNKYRQHLLYRTWHLRDVVWREDYDGKIDFVARRCKMAMQDVLTYFPKAPLDPKIARAATKTPFAEMEIMHIVCAAELWDGEARGKPRISIYYDATHDKVIEEVPIWGRFYIIPRWGTVSGSQYGSSPATVAALPEGRLLQAMVLTILEAGEKAVNPPLIATKDVVKSDMQQFPGGVTWVDMEYDERLGEALRAMNIDVKGLPITLEMMKDSRAVLSQCFFLNKLRAFNPTTDPTMTAFQAGQIVQEYIRGALPLFEPMEMDYNGGLCEETFDLLYRNSAFGSPMDVPRSLRNADIDFRFESPLHDAIESAKGTKFLEFGQIVAQAVQLDPDAIHIPDAKTILRDVANGIKVPSTWLHTEQEVKASSAAVANQVQQQQTLDTMQKGADVAQTLGAAKKDMAQSEVAAGAQAPA
jgi:hypothetical protein